MGEAAVEIEPLVSLYLQFEQREGFVKDAALDRFFLLRFLFFRVAARGLDVAKLEVRLHLAVEAHFVDAEEMEGRRIVKEGRGVSEGAIYRRRA